MGMTCLYSCHARPCYPFHCVRRSTNNRQYMLPVNQPNHHPIYNHSNHNHKSQSLTQSHRVRRPTVNEQRMFRIINAQWTFPEATSPASPPSLISPAVSPAVSPDCRDLLSRLLVVDPARRLSVEQIVAHPWFVMNLPQAAATMNEAYLAADDYTGVQSEEEIRAVLGEALGSGMPGASSSAEAGEGPGLAAEMGLGGGGGGDEARGQRAAGSIGTSAWIDDAMEQDMSWSGAGVQVITSMQPGVPPGQQPGADSRT